MERSATPARLQGGRDAGAGAAAGADDRDRDRRLQQRQLPALSAARLLAALDRGVPDRAAVPGELPVLLPPGAGGDADLDRARHGRRRRHVAPRLSRPRGRSAAVILAPIVLPGMVLGLALATSSTPPSRWASSAPSPACCSPMCWSPCPSSSPPSAPPSPASTGHLEDAARSLGAGPVRAFFDVTMREIAPGHPRRGDLRLHRVVRPVRRLAVPRDQRDAAPAGGPLRSRSATAPIRPSPPPACSRSPPSSSA